MSRLVLAIIALAVLAPAAQAAPKRADLTVSKVTVSASSLAQGAQLTVSWTVKNAGRASAGKSTTEVVLSTDAKRRPRGRAPRHRRREGGQGAQERHREADRADLRGAAPLVGAGVRRRAQEGPREQGDQQLPRGGGHRDRAAAPAPARRSRPAPVAGHARADGVADAAPTDGADHAPPRRRPRPRRPTPTRPTRRSPSGPPAVTALDSAEFTFTSPTGTSFECRLGDRRLRPLHVPEDLHGRARRRARLRGPRAQRRAAASTRRPPARRWRIEFEGARPRPRPRPPRARARDQGRHAATPARRRCSPTARSSSTPAADPIQKGVADGAIEPLRAAVLRGKVTRRDGSPVAGVEVSVLDRPELGHTATRTDGGFDLAVNGGGFVTRRLQARGLHPQPAPARGPDAGLRDRRGRRAGPLRRPRHRRRPRRRRASPRARRSPTATARAARRCSSSPAPRPRRRSRTARPSRSATA